MPVVTACTPGPYRNAAKRLELSCVDVGVDCFTLFLDDRAWKNASACKPLAVLSVLRRGLLSVIWLDADCVLTAPPPGNIAGDIAFSSRRHGETGEPIPPETRIWDFKQGKSIPNANDEYTPWGGWIYFRNTPEVRALVETWAELCAAHYEVCSDEQCLMEALRRHPNIQQGELLLKGWGKHYPMGKFNGKPGGDWL